MVCKFEMSTMFEKFRRNVELQTGYKLKKSQPDNALEFKMMTKFFLSNLNIEHRLSIPYSHQKMRIVECRHRHLVDIAVTMLNQASLPKQFWYYAMLMTCFLYNRNPSQVRAAQKITLGASLWPHSELMH